MPAKLSSVDLERVEFISTAAALISAAAESESAESAAAKSGNAREGRTQKQRKRTALIERDRTLIAEERERKRVWDGERERGFGMVREKVAQSDARRKLAWRAPSSSSGFAGFFLAFL